MNEQNEEVKRVPATEKPHYWIYKEGVEVWNRWAEGAYFRNDQKVLANIINNCGSAHKIPEPHEVIDFSSCEWPENEDIKFNGFIFPSITIFDDSLFKSTISFIQAVFEKQALFAHTTFWSYANFSQAAFKNNAFFHESIFCKDTAFVTAQFHNMARFSNTEFNYPLNLSSCTFHSTLSLENAKFSDVPDLRGSDIKGEFKLPRGNLLRLKSKAEDYEKWAKLKYEMNRQHLHREELDYFTKELECRELGGDWKEKSLIGLYNAIADYGSSALKPSFWLFMFGWTFFMIYYSFTLDISEAFSVSLNNSFPLIPFHNESSKAPQLIQGTQILLSSVLIFLILLGIRNRLRIK